MTGDRDLLAFRQGYYGLFVSLLWREPSGELIGELGRGIEQRVAGAEALDPRMADGWRRIAAFLETTPAANLGEAVADEYTRLFLGPFGTLLHPYESFYLTGRVLERPLADLRAELRSLGIARDERYAEPEDFLAFELEVMRRLLQRQAEAADRETEARWLRAQADFLRRHLLVWGPAAARDLAEAERAVFYRGVGLLLAGFLEWERDLFEGWSPGPVESIEEARARLTGTGQWRGPLFDDPGGAAPEAAPGDGEGGPGAGQAPGPGA